MEKQLLTLAILAFFAYTLYQNQSNDTDILQEFESFKVQYNKKYSSIEDTYRLGVFQQNYNTILATNLKQSKYTFAINEFADLTDEEFTSIYLRSNPIPIDAPIYTSQLNSIPLEVDLRQKGLVGPIKNQGQCGSCWAFSAIGSVEGVISLKTGVVPDLSEQQLVDCAKGKYGNDGCNGGLHWQGMKYVRDVGISSEYDYPYQGRDGKCQKRGGEYKISGFKRIQNNVQDLKQALSQQPVSVSVNANEWRFYKSGIFDCSREYSEDELNHDILGIGYGEGYILVKNSWGTGWGEQGLIRLKQESGCGVLEYSFMGQ